VIGQDEPGQSLKYVGIELMELARASIMSKTVLIPCPLCRSEKGFRANNTDKDLHIKKYGELYAGLAKSEWRV